MKALFLCALSQFNMDIFSNSKGFDFEYALQFPNMVSSNGEENLPDEPVTLRQYHRSVVQKISVYYRSLPGWRNTVSSNHVTSLFQNILKTKQPRYEELDEAMVLLSYRMGLMEHANKICKVIGLSEVPRCQEIDMDSWHCPSVHHKAYRYALDAIHKHRIFGKPSGQQGPEFHKVYMYLAACITSAGWANAEIDHAIRNIIKCKSRLYLLSQLDVSLNDPAIKDRDTSDIVESFLAYSNGALNDQTKEQLRSELESLSEEQHVAYVEEDQSKGIDESSWNW